MVLSMSTCLLRILTIPVAVDSVRLDSGGCAAFVRCVYNISYCKKSIVEKMFNEAAGVIAAWAVAELVDGFPSRCLLVAGTGSTSATAYLFSV